MLLNDNDFFVNNFSGQPPSAEVPEKIRKWKEDQETRLKEKDSAEEIAKEVLRKVQKL
jgi:Clathrin light chain